MVTPYYKLVCVLLALVMLFGLANTSVAALAVDDETEEITETTIDSDLPESETDAESNEATSPVNPIPMPEPEDETPNQLNIIAHTLALKENTYSNSPRLPTSK